MRSYNIWSTRLTATVVLPFECAACGHKASAVVETPGVAAQQLPVSVQAPSGIVMRESALGDARARAATLARLAPCPRCHRRARGPALRLWGGRLAGVTACLAVAALLGYMLVMLFRERGSLLAAVACLLGVLGCALGGFVALRTARWRWRASRELVTFPDEPPSRPAPPAPG